MKKILGFVLAVFLLCTAWGAPAEEGKGAPLYATVGEALEDSPEERMIAGGIAGEYFAVVTQKDGKYYRSVAYADEKLSGLEEAVDSLDYEAEDFFEQLEAAMNAAEEYRKTLPIAYTEEFTAMPMTDGEMEARIGKTLDQLTEEGFEIGSSGTESGEGDEIRIVYLMRYGVYDYSCVVDADFDSYIAAQENGTEGGLVVKGMTVAGITEWGYDKRFHADGTVEEPEDPFAEFNEILSGFSMLCQHAQDGGEIDIGEFAGRMKEDHPDYAEMIDLYVTMYQTYGIEGLASMMASDE